MTKTKTKTKKNYVLDTNILLTDPESIFSFGENDVYIPMTVIEELDSKKSEHRSAIGYNARVVIRQITELLKEPMDSGKTNAKLPSGASLHIIDDNSSDNKYGLDLSKADNRIINSIGSLKKKNVVFVSKDLNLKLKCNALGIKTEDYKKELVETDYKAQKNREIIVDDEVIDELYASKDLGLHDDDGLLGLNERAVFKSAYSTKSALVCKQDSNIRVIAKAGPVWGVEGKNAEQKLAIDALLDPDVKVLALIGPAGCGKTYLTLACGLDLVVNSKQYDKLLVCKPVIPLGSQDIGFLPGNEQEKLGPWFGSIYDNMDALAKYPAKGIGTKNWNELKAFEMVDILPLYSLRGRSIQRSLIYIDEAQNMTQAEMKTLMTRVGEGSKIILSGDPSQIDAQFVDSTNNGLVHIVDKFNNDDEAKKIFSVCYLTESRRSDVAKISVRLL